MISRGLPRITQKRVRWFETKHKGAKLRLEPKQPARGLKLLGKMSLGPSLNDEMLGPSQWLGRLQDQ